MTSIFYIILVPLVWVLWLWLGKRGVRTNRTAILATAIPPIVLAIVGLILHLLGRPLRDVADICVGVSFVLAIAAMLSSIVYAIRRKWEIAKGTGFGSGIGFVVWVIALPLSIALYYG